MKLYYIRIVEMLCFFNKVNNYGGACMKKVIGWLLFLLVIASGVILAQEKELLFTANEVESMLALYNQAPVKGDQVELVAPVGMKLRQALTVARSQADSTKLIKLLLTSTEVQICYNILTISTFEARYAELVLGMKRKLQKLLPPPMPPEQPATAAPAPKK